VRDRAPKKNNKVKVKDLKIPKCFDSVSRLVGHAPGDRSHDDMAVIA